MKSTCKQLLSATLTKTEVEYAQKYLNSKKPSLPNTQSSMLDELTTKLKNRFNTNYCFSFMGGRASLFAIIKALNLPKDSEILVPAFTCQAVINALGNNSEQIKYVDIEAETYGMDAECLDKSITKNSRVLFIQYSFGLICRDLERLLAIAKAHNLIIIEDCAHAIGATYNGIEVGNFGDIAFFSSERSKLINTIHGGFVICHNEAHGKALQSVYDTANFPPKKFTQRLFITLIDNYYRYVSPDSKQLQKIAKTKIGLLPQMFNSELNGHISPNYHYKMPDSIAGLMLIQLKGLTKRFTIRNKNAQHWFNIAKEKGWKTPTVIANSSPAWLRYPVEATESLKKELIANPYYLKDQFNAAVGVWFTSAAHPTPIHLPHCPTGTRLARCCINFPTY